MQEYNICRFIPFRKSNNTNISIINFVFETKEQVFDKLKMETLYKMYLATEGEGIFHTAGNSFDVKAGDVFFGFPSVPYALESIDNFKYMYINFIGNRGNQIMDELMISSSNLIFRNNINLIPFWKDAINTSLDYIDMAAESALLYTFSKIGNKKQNSNPAQNGAAAQIKKYIDDNFSDLDLTLEKISKNLSYNPKYISFVFKKAMKIRVSDYINTIRIRNACVLMEQNFTCIKDISYLCGFSDPAYFSRAFKSKMGASPSVYMHSVQI